MQNDKGDAIEIMLNTIVTLGAQVTSLITLVKVLAITHPDLKRLDSELADKIETLDAIYNGLPTPDHLNTTMLALLEDVQSVVRSRL